MSALHTLLETINKDLFNVTLKNINDSSTACTSVQNINFTKLKLKKCNLTVSQDTQVLCELQKITGLRDKNELLKTLKQSIDESSQSENKEVSGFLATSISSNNTDTTVSTYIKQILETNITDEVLSSCIASSNVEQNLNTSLEINCSSNPDFDNKIVQNIQIYQFASCITNKVSNILLNDTKINNIKVKTTQITDVFKAGLDKNFLKILLVVIGLMILTYIMFIIIRLSK